MRTNVFLATLIATASLALMTATPASAGPGLGIMRDCPAEPQYGEDLQCYIEYDTTRVRLLCWTGSPTYCFLETDDVGGTNVDENCSVVVGGELVFRLSCSGQATFSVPPS